MGIALGSELEARINLLQLLLDILLEISIVT
jgi:hypothetical protein